MSRRPSGPAARATEQRGDHPQAVAAPGVRGNADYHYCRRALRLGARGADGHQAPTPESARSRGGEAPSTYGNCQGSISTGCPAGLMRLTAQSISLVERLAAGGGRRQQPNRRHNYSHGYVHGAKHDRIRWRAMSETFSDNPHTARPRFASPRERIICRVYLPCTASELTLRHPNRTWAHGPSTGMADIKIFCDLLPG